MKILITGSEGNIGRRLTEHLQKSHEVFGIDIKQGFRSGFQTIDINNGADLVNVFYEFKPDTVIHLAAMVSRVTCERSPATAIRTNISGTENIIQLCKQINAKLVFFSTSEVYGNIEGILSEDRTDLNPVNLYGLSKLIGESLVNYEHRDWTILRPFMFYDERETIGDHRSAMIRFAVNLLKGLPIEVHRDSYRSWLHIDDGVRIIERLLYHDGTINIGSPEIISTLHLAELMCEYIGCPKSLIKVTELPKQMILTKHPDLRKQTRLSMLTPRINIETGIKKVIDYVRSTH